MGRITEAIKKLTGKTKPEREVKIRKEGMSPKYYGQYLISHNLYHRRKGK